MSRVIDEPSYYDRDLVEKHLPQLPLERLSPCGHYIELTNAEASTVMRKTGLDELECFSLPPAPAGLDLTIEELWAEACRQSDQEDAEVMGILQPRQLIITRKVDLIADDDLQAMRKDKVPLGNFWNVVAVIGGGMRLQRPRLEAVKELLAKVLEQQAIEGGASFGVMFVP